MSLSQPSNMSNPAKRFISWKGDEGKLVYWDSEAKQEKEVKRPFKFAVLDELHCVTGFYETDNSGIWSNELKNLGQKLTLHTSAGILLEGLYADIKDSIKSKGGKYTKSIYLATEIDGELAIANLKLKGAGFGPWMDFTKQGSVYGNWTIIEEKTVEGKKGKTVYQMPVFSPEAMSDADKTRAIELDKQLQDFLSSKGILPSDGPDRKDSEPISQADVLLTAKEEDDIDGQKPIDLSEIPF